MNRWPRILLNTAAALSLALFVAVCVLWVRSHDGHFDSMELGPARDVEFYAASSEGEVALAVGVIVPHALVAVIAALLPAAWLTHRFVARRRAWRRCAGDGAAVPCATCGYDLRATPGRCPECGMDATTTATV